jgi:hypothetical protein
MSSLKNVTLYLHQTIPEPDKGNRLPPPLSAQKIETYDREDDILYSCPCALFASVQYC